MRFLFFCVFFNAYRVKYNKSYNFNMVSLSYFDEHLAWQQRVQKEITLAYRAK